MTENRYAHWFGRALWLTVFVNLGLAVPALFTPSTFSAVFGLGTLPAPATVWLRAAGMLCVLLAGFYILIASDPLDSVKFARWAVACMFLSAGFWLWAVVCLDLPARFWWFFGIELALGVLLAFLLFRALAVTPPPEPKPWRRSFFDRLYGGFFAWLERRGIRWYHLWPSLFGSIGTGGLRRELRANNLHAFPGDVPDSAENRLESDPANPPSPLPAWDEAYRDNRSPDGSYNDLSAPAMGMVGMRFGRNAPAAEVWPKVPPEGDPAQGFPSPRDVSVKLLARPMEAGQPKMTEATILNLFAAAWIQFQNHGWFNHRIPRMTIDPATGFPVPADPVTGAPLPAAPADFITVPLKPDDEWRQRTGQTEMRIRRTVPDPTRPANAPYPPTYRTTDTHWWDASQIYGTNLFTMQPLRTFADGKLKVEHHALKFPKAQWEEVLLPLDTSPLATDRNGKQGLDLTGFNDNHWVGVSLLHTLFVREHNYLCDRLRETYANDLSGLPAAKVDEWLFGKARLVCAALMAKIHTIEWTTAILPNPRLWIDMNSNWWGVLGRWVKLRFGRLSSNEGISGIIGSAAGHQAAPYSLTEEFVAVYRLHPLIPDVVRIHEAIETGNPTDPIPFHELQGAQTRDAVLRHGMVNWLYSCGKQSPGAVTLRNYPRALREHERMNGEKLDLATRDIVRDRERGVPLYNAFRTMLRMQPVKSYEELVGHREDREYLVRTLRELYGTTDGRDNVDRIDLMVGLFAEKLPPAFGFSDTAFRIFILMASRRLKSDRFFTDDFRPEVYTPFGMDWVNNETMASMLERHFPVLRGKVPAGRAVFAPW